MHAVRDGYLVSDDRSLLDFAVIHGFLTRSYWSPGIPRETVERAARHSLPVGLYRSAASNQQRQIGYMRLLTDFSVFAYVLDVFVLEDFRGQGLARWMVQTALSDPALQGVRTWMLGTRDSHGLYRKLGFTEVEDPRRYMRRSVAPEWFVQPG